jgi:hypothetical protein
VKRSKSVATLRKGAVGAKKAAAMPENLNNEAPATGGAVVGSKRKTPPSTPAKNDPTPGKVGQSLSSSSTPAGKRARNDDILKAANLADNFAHTQVPSNFGRAAYRIGYKITGSKAEARVSRDGNHQTDWTAMSFLLKNKKVLMAKPGYNNDTAKTSMVVALTKEEAAWLLDWARVEVNLFWKFTEPGNTLQCHNAKKPPTKWRKALVQNFGEVHGIEQSASAMLEFLADQHAMDYPGAPVPEGGDLIFKYRNNPGFIEERTNILLAPRVKEYNDNWELHTTCEASVPIILPVVGADDKPKKSFIQANELRKGDTFHQVFFRMVPGVTQGGGPSLNFNFVHKKAGAKPILKSERGDKKRSEETPEETHQREQRNAAKKAREAAAGEKLDDQEMFAACGQ